MYTQFKTSFLNQNLLKFVKGGSGFGESSTSSPTVDSHREELSRRQVGLLLIGMGKTMVAVGEHLAKKE